MGKEKKKVLIVDDDPAMRRALRVLLDGMDLQAIEADDGDRALQALRRERPGLVLLDIHMPKLDGMAVMDAILETCPGLGVIVVTGDGDEGHAQLAMEKGACDFILKPFDIDSFKNSVAMNFFARS